MIISAFINEDKASYFSSPLRFAIHALTSPPPTKTSLFLRNETL
jgi:hypothetical protein